VAFDPTRARWRKSSYSSGGEANCVEVALSPEVIGIRDTKDRTAGHLIIASRSWSSLLDQLGRQP
jgi:hypothetical protein